MRYSIIGATVQQVKSVGGTDIKESRRIGIIFATLRDEQAARLRSLGCRVDQVGKVQATIMPPIVAPPVPVAAAPTYSPEELIYASGLEALRAITDPPLYGEGYTLAIVDTGIRESHERIGGRVVYSKNYTSDPMRDGFNHGSGVCSIALAVAPLANILNLKVLNDKGEGNEEDVVLAIDDCIDFYDTQPEIAPWAINLSLGAPDDGNPNNVLRVACRAAIERGIWVIASAGNGGAPMTITNPACEEYVFAIGSSKYLPEEREFVVSGFSSRGPTKEGLVKPDTLMFGEDIVVASSSSDTATIAKSGTSFATPFGSGLTLLYFEGALRVGGVSYPGVVPPSIHPELPPGTMTTVENMLDLYLGNVCVKPAGVAAGKDYDYGYGLPVGVQVAELLGLRPAVEIPEILSSLMPLVVIGMLGMMMGAMSRGLK